jgi:hypothetical protein
MTFDEVIMTEVQVKHIGPRPGPNDLSTNLKKAAYYFSLQKL